MNKKMPRNISPPKPTATTYVSENPPKGQLRDILRLNNFYAPWPFPTLHMWGCRRIYTPRWCLAACCQVTA